MEISMFKLHLVNRENQELTLMYDPYKGSLLNLVGQPVFAEHTGEAITPKGVAPWEPTGKSSAVKRLKIQLGLKCNYSCSYCLQSAEIPDATVSSLSDAKEFLTRMDDWLSSAPDKIEFWGGEPLVYWKKLKVLLPALRDKFPSATLVMITNGSLLTDEITSVLIENSVTVAMSHDGPGHSLRGEDPLTNPVVLQCVKRLLDQHKEYFSFLSVITKQAPNPNQTIRYFESIFGSEVPVGFEGVVSHYSSESVHQSGLSGKQLEELTDHIFYGLVGGEHVAKSPTFVNKTNSLIDKLLSGFGVGGVQYSKCGMDQPDHIACDLQGNITTCQNTGANGRHYVGSVYDMEAAQLTSSTHFSRRHSCTSCPVVASCIGGCMYQETADFTATCKGEFALNMGVLKAALYNALGGFVLTNITYPESNLISLHAID